MEDAFKGQVTRSAAEIYEEFFVPALFAEWAPKVADEAGLASGQKALDVACGTGVLTRAAVRRVQPGGSVTGLDRNEGMLAVARRAVPSAEWRLGKAEELPFAAASFDAVLSQFGLMFFEDRVAALSEMWRVLRLGGRLAVGVWDALERSPGYADMVALLQRLFGAEIADQLRAPFVLGDPAMLRSHFTEAGIPDVVIRTAEGTASFGSFEDWVRTDIKGWTLADLIDDEQYRTLQREAVGALGRHVQEDGSVRFSSPPHIVAVSKA
jgi:SAM-dependent methyltransferase